MAIVDNEAFNTDLDEMELAFDNIIEIQSRLYDLTVRELKSLEEAGLEGTEDYNEVLKEIEVFKRKEQRIIDRFQSPIGYHHLQTEITNYLQAECEDDDKKSNYLYMRINNIFSHIPNTFKSDEEIDDEEYVDSDSQVTLLQYGNNIIGMQIKTDDSPDDYDFVPEFVLDFLKNLKNYQMDQSSALEYKYYNAFVYKPVDDELFACGYNLEHLQKPYSIELKQLEKYNKQNYEEIKENAKHQYSINLLTVFFNHIINPEITEEKLSMLYGEIVMSLNGQTKEHILKILHMSENLNFSDYPISDESAHYLKNIYDLLKEKIKEPEDYQTSFYQLPEDLDKLLTNITKTAEYIFEGFHSLFQLHKKDKRNTKEYQKLIPPLDVANETLENYLEQLTEFEDIPDKILNIIQTYVVNLVSETENAETEMAVMKKQLIFEHILNKFELKNGFEFYYASDSEMYYIIKNHRLECAKGLLKKSQKKPEFLEVFYSEAFLDSFVANEFLFQKGQIEKSVILDDESLAAILKVSLKEYQNDKERWLFEECNELLQNISQFTSDDDLTPLEQASVEYDGMCLEVACQYLGAEAMETLEENYTTFSSVSSTPSYKKLNKLFSQEKPNILTLMPKNPSQ